MSKRSHKNDAPRGPSLPVPLTQKIGLGLMAILHVVCPLLFFTNLTRNPYYTQIALLNIAIAFAGLLWAFDVWRKAVWRLPRVSFEVPLLAFLIVAFISTINSWWAHPLLRYGIQSEAIRIWSFTLVNSCLAFYLPILFIKPAGDNHKPISIWADIFFAFIWGIMWFGFHTMKDPNPHSLIWDPYGGFLWGIALVYAFLRVKRGDAMGIFHMVFAVAMIAGGYGLLQYMGRDIIWGSPIQPYGGRPVSTFGNPNFLSAYLMLVSPLALGVALKSKGSQAWGYGVVFFICTLSALGTLTRSTYVGLLMAFAALALILFRREHIRIVKWAVLSMGLLLLLIWIFPATPVHSVQSPFARFTEIIDAIQSGKPYGPWHQRILIWSSAWDMVQERILFGKGWGCFELFYPFYQGGHILVDVYSQYRTHANNAHNILMEVWSQVGTVGTGVAVWLMGTLFWGGWKIVRKKADGFSKVLAAALLASFVGMMGDNFFGNVSIFFAVPAFLFWWNMGSLYNEAGSVLIQEKPVSKVWGRLLLVLFMAFCLLVVVYFVKRWKQEFYYFQGFKAAKAGQVKASVENLEKAYKWFPAEVNSNYELGNSYARYAKMLADKNLSAESNRFKEKAIWAYEAALKANPGYDEIYFNLGVTHSQLGNKEEGRRKLEMALFINPLLRDAYASLSNMHVLNNDLEAARHVLSLAAETFPKDKELKLNLGYTYTKLGQHENAYETYKAAYQIDPKYSQAWNNLRIVAKELGRTEPLLEAPNLIEAVEKAVKKKDYAAAEKAAGRLVVLFPDHPDIRLSWGNTLFYLGKTDQSIQELKKALELNPRLMSAYINLGKVYQSLGRLDEARVQYETVLKYRKKHKEATPLLKALSSL